MQGGELRETGSEENWLGKVTQAAVGPSWKLGSTANKMGAIVGLRLLWLLVWREHVVGVEERSKDIQEEADAETPLTYDGGV